MVEEIVLNSTQVAAMGKQNRRDVLSAVVALGRATAAEVGAHLGRPPSSVTYHIHKLVEVGLLQEVERRPTGKKPEAVYATVARRMTLPRTDAGSPARKAQVASVAAGLRTTVRRYEALASSAEPHAHVVRATLRLSDEDLKKFLTMVDAAVKFAYDNRDPDAPVYDWASVGFYRAP